MAYFHIFGFTTQEKTPSVNLIYVHPKGEQPVVHDEAGEPDKYQAAADSAVSNLMRYFGRPVSSMCDDLNYPRYLELFFVGRMEIFSKRRRTHTSPDADNCDSSADEQPPAATATLRDRYRDVIYRKVTANASRIQYMSPD